MPSSDISFRGLHTPLYCAEHPLTPWRSIASLNIQQVFSNLGDILEVEVLVALLVVAERVRFVDTDCTHRVSISAMLIRTPHTSTEAEATARNNSASMSQACSWVGHALFSGSSP